MRSLRSPDRPAPSGPTTACSARASRAIERFEAVQNATAGERSALDAATREHGRRINDWLDTFEAGTMPDEAVAFMYMLLASDEMGHEWPAR